MAGHPDTEGRTERIKAVLTENGIILEELDEQTANWDILQAQNIANTWIKKYGDSIEFIFSNNDSMALGALKSIQAQGYNIGDESKYIPIVGVARYLSEPAVNFHQLKIGRPLFEIGNDDFIAIGTLFIAAPDERRRA